MKRKGLFSAIAFVFALLLSSCVSESYVKKVEDAAAIGEHLTYAEVYEDLGEATIEGGVEGKYATGVFIWVVGCEDYDDVEVKLEEGKTLKALYITFAAGKAISASWKEYTSEEK